MLDYGGLRSVPSKVSAATARWAVQQKGGRLKHSCAGGESPTACQEETRRAQIGGLQSRLSGWTDHKMVVLTFAWSTVTVQTSLGIILFLFLSIFTCFTPSHWTKTRHFSHLSVRTTQHQILQWVTNPRRTFSDWVNLTRHRDVTKATVETATQLCLFFFLPNNKMSSSLSHYHTLHQLHAYIWICLKQLLLVDIKESFFFLASKIMKRERKKTLKRAKPTNKWKYIVNMQVFVLSGGGFTQFCYY